MNWLTAKYLVDPFSPLKKYLNGTSIRNELRPMRWPNQRFRRSFYSDAVKSWINIEPELRKTTNTSIYKDTIEEMIVAEDKCIFNIYGQDLRYLYQFVSHPIAFSVLK